MKQTNEKRNLIKRIMLILCAAVVAISTVLGSGATEVQAASKAKKAMAAYAKYLEDGSHWNDDGKYTTFGLIDANRDGIKELVVYDDGTRTTSLLAYSSGKIKELGWCMAGGVIVYSKKKVFECNDHPGSGIYATIHYTYDGKKAKEIARWEKFDEEETYTVKGKKTSEKKYNKYIKSLHLGKGISSWNINMHKNTKENRKKYLK